MDSAELRKRIEARSQPEPNSGCWIWLGVVMKSRGGSCQYGGISAFGKYQRAHRVSYLAFNGEIPSGLLVLHDCDNGLCVNPKHLRVGTQSQNILDAVRRGRVLPPGGAVSEYTLSKITAAIVARDFKSKKQVMKELGVSRYAVEKATKKLREL